MNIRRAELMQLKDIITTNNNVFFDTSGLKELLFVVEKLLMNFTAEKIIYGSQYPLHCLKSTILLIEKAEIEESIKDKILSKNINHLK